MQMHLELPSLDSYCALREEVGWEPTHTDQARQALGQTLHAVSVREKGNLRAFGRIVGDGGIYNYFQDVMVAPGSQGEGLGTVVMEALKHALTPRSPEAFYGLLAVPGSEEFYGRFGFVPQTPQNTVMTLPSQEAS